MIRFHYSNIYDMNLARWRESAWNISHEIRGKKHAGILQVAWNKREQTIVEFLCQIGFIFPSDINGYVVSSWDGITAFSDPLTIPIIKDFDASMVKIVHELIHIILSYEKNKKIKEEINAHLAEKFKTESYAVRIHIVVNLIQKASMSKNLDLLPLLENEKDVPETLYPGQARAWHLLDKMGVDSAKGNPIETLINL